MSAMTPEQIDASHRFAADTGAEFALKGDRYTPTGGVRHRTRPNFLESSTRVASCGLSANESYWRGTGSQDEYERLFRIPRCARCIEAERTPPLAGSPRPEQETSK